MVQRSRLWLGIGLFATATGLPARGQGSPDRIAPPRVQVATGEGGEGGERGHAGHPADLARDDAAFLAALGMIEGHLLVATELYASGQRADAMPHVKHPEDEIYGNLRPALEARRIGGFESSLTAMARAAESGAPPEQVSAAFAAVRAELARVRGAVQAGPSATVAAAAQMVADAGDEYDEGVAGGRVVNVKEYHDAYGFVRVAGAWVAGLDPAVRARHADGVRRIEAALAGLAPAWPSLAARTVPEGFDGTRFEAAAAVIALEARDLR